MVQTGERVGQPFGPAVNQAPQSLIPPPAQVLPHAAGAQPELGRFGRDPVLHRKRWVVLRPRLPRNSDGRLTAAESGGQLQQVRLQPARGLGEPDHVMPLVLEPDPCPDAQASRPVHRPGSHARTTVLSRSGPLSRSATSSPRHSRWNTTGRAISATGAAPTKSPRRIGSQASSTNPSINSAPRYTGRR